MEQKRGIKGYADALFSHDFVRFCMVGALGFLINLVILKLLHDISHWPIVLATLLGSEVAYFSNFLFHNFWTYKHHSKIEKSLLRLLVQFHLSAWSSIVLNAVIVYAVVTFFRLDSAIELAIASVIV